MDAGIQVSPSRLQEDNSSALPFLPNEVLMYLFAYVPLNVVRMLGKSWASEFSKNKHFPAPPWRSRIYAHRRMDYKNGKTKYYVYRINCTDRGIHRSRALATISLLTQRGIANMQEAANHYDIYPDPRCNRDTMLTNGNMDEVAMPLKFVNVMSCDNQYLHYNLWKRYIWNTYVYGVVYCNSYDGLHVKFKTHKQLLSAIRRSFENILCVNRIPYLKMGFRRSEDMKCIVLAEHYKHECNNTIFPYRVRCNWRPKVEAWLNQESNV